MNLWKIVSFRQRFWAVSSTVFFLFVALPAMAQTANPLTSFLVSPDGAHVRAFKAQVRQAIAAVDFDTTVLLEKQRIRDARVAQSVSRIKKINDLNSLASGVLSGTLGVLSPSMSYPVSRISPDVPTNVSLIGGSTSLLLTGTGLMWGHISDAYGDIKRRGYEPCTLRQILEATSLPPKITAVPNLPPRLSGKASNISPIDDDVLKFACFCKLGDAPYMQSRIEDEIQLQLKQKNKRFRNYGLMGPPNNKNNYGVQPMFGTDLQKVSFRDYLCAYWLGCTDGKPNDAKEIQKKYRDASTEFTDTDIQLRLALLNQFRVFLDRADQFADELL